MSVIGMMPYMDYSCVLMSSQPDPLRSCGYLMHTPNPKYLHDCTDGATTNDVDQENNLSKDLKNLILSSDSYSRNDDRNCLEKPNTKRVKFADSVGLDLVQIRIMTAGRDTPPNLDPSILAVFRDSNNEKPTGPSFSLDFKQPVSDYGNFRECLERNKVSLESLSVSDNRLIGTIKVKNLSFHKEVFVRLSFDNWDSREDIQAYYVNNGLIYTQTTPIASTIDTFSFEYEILSNKLTANPISFAICFRCQGQEFWDNHYGKNYKIMVHNPPKSAAKLAYRKDSCDLLPQNTNWTEFAVWQHLEHDFSPYW